MAFVGVTPRTVTSTSPPEARFDAEETWDSQTEPVGRVTGPGVVVSALVVSALGLSASSVSAAAAAASSSAVVDGDDDGASAVSLLSAVSVFSGLS